VGKQRTSSCLSPARGIQDLQGLLGRKPLPVNSPLPPLPDPWYLSTPPIKIRKGKRNKKKRGKRKKKKPSEFPTKDTLVTLHALPRTKKKKKKIPLSFLLRNLRLQ